MESTYEIIVAVVAAATIGQALLTASLLAVRKDPRRIYLPLFVFFVANAVAKFYGIAEALATTRETLPFRHFLDMSSMVAFTLISPSIWLYVRALTSEYTLRFSMRDSWHLLPFGIALIISLFILSSPFEIRHELLGDGEPTDSLQVILLAVALLTLLFTWVVQTTIYVFKIYIRLTRYRTRLRDIFASTRGRELHWISWVVTLLVINLLSVGTEMFYVMTPAIGILTDTFDFALVWIFSLWGLRATPAIEGAGGPRPDADSVPEDRDGAGVRKSAAKYEKSALTAEHLERISEKLNRVMNDQKLYLEPSLSLRDLAKAVSTPPNYVSQTLNSEIGETFFDYVNGWRVRDAMPKIRGSQESILSILYEVGFNSRSSFYKAFKRETGMTPRAYRDAIAAE
ncbi:MAG: AraC family transcriptional regulator [Pseudomonadota bacterium]